MIATTGKVLFVLGLALAGLGLLLLLADKTGWLQALWNRIPLGRLPGDIRFERGHFSLYFPWVTCLVVSVVATVILSLFRK